MVTKKLLKNGIFFVIAVNFLFGLNGYCQEIKGVPEQDIMEEFAEVMYYNAIPKPIDQITNSDAQETILPIAAELIKETIEHIYVRKGDSLEAEDVIEALPDVIADVLRPEKEKIKEAVSKLQEVQEK